MRILLILLTLVYSTLIQAQTQTMSLQQCIDYALENNEKLKIANLEKGRADDQVKEILAAGFPQASLNGALNYNFEVQTSLIDASNFSDTVPKGTEVPFKFGQAYDGNLVFSVNQLIFDGSYFVGLEAAKTYRELSAKDRIREEIEIREAVIKAYFNALITAERAEMVAKNFSRIDTLLFETDQMYQNGFAEKIDVTRLRVSYNNVQVEKKKLERFYEISFMLLKFQMGMPLDETLELSDSIEGIQLDMPFVADFSYKDRIEYSQLNTNQNLARLDAKNQKVQYLPKVYAGFNYGWNTATSTASNWLNNDRWFDFGSVGLTVSVPLFDGFHKRSKIQSIQKQIDQIEFAKMSLQKGIDLEITQNRLNLESNIEMVDVQRQNMELAEEVYNTAKVKYSEGVGSNLEVITADSSLKEAQTNYYNALYNAIVSKISLEKALGILHKS